MTFKEFQNQLSEGSTMVCQLAEKQCTNFISDNFVYILSEIEVNEKGNSFTQRGKRKKENDAKKVMILQDVARLLFDQFYDLYDVNFFIYRAEVNRTIIDIRYLKKSAIEKEFKNRITLDKPLFHVKLSLPPGLQTNEKFDVNWEHEIS